MTTNPKTYSGTLSLQQDKLTFDWHEPPPKEGGVYEIHAPLPLPRLRGHSSTLYIGQSGNVRKRVEQIARWEHSVVYRLYEVLRNGDPWQGAEQRCRVEVTITPESESDPELEEVRRLHNFESAHCELPPLNRSSPGSMVLLALQRFMQGLADQLCQLKGLGPDALRVQRAWDDVDDEISYADLKFRGVIRVTLAWVWPESWRESGMRPDWWPTKRMDFQNEALFLFVAEDWGPHGHDPAVPSKHWCRCLEDNTWLGNPDYIPLPLSLMKNPPEALVKLLVKGALGKGDKTIAPDANMSHALRTAWANLATRITDVVSKHPPQ